MTDFNMENEGTFFSTVNAKESIPDWDEDSIEEISEYIREQLTELNLEEVIEQLL